MGLWNSPLSSCSLSSPHTAFPFPPIIVSHLGSAMLPSVGSSFWALLNTVTDPPPVLILWLLPLCSSPPAWLVRGTLLCLTTALVVTPRCPAMTAWVVMLGIWVFKSRYYRIFYRQQWGTAHLYHGQLACIPIANPSFSTLPSSCPSASKLPIRDPIDGSATLDIWVCLWLNAPVLVCLVPGRCSTSKC